MAFINKLSAIGDAIREKTGKTDLMTLDAMPAEIASIETGGGGGIEVEPIVLTGNCQKACSGAIADTYLKNYGNTVSTKDISNAVSMFEKSTLERIPFDLNFTSDCVLYQTFANCGQLLEIPDAYGGHSSYDNGHNIFTGCVKIKRIPDSWGNLNWKSGFYGVASTFQRCYNLRYIPTGFLQNHYMSASYPYGYADSIFYDCWSLDEIVGFVGCKGNITSNKLSNCWANCYRLKKFTFDMQDGNVMVLPWKSQTINLCYAGYVSPTYQVAGFMDTTGFTYDTRITDDATYQTLKNNEDYWTSDLNYSRYNRISAVETINSLPDCSATGTNTIKFMGSAGALTDGGAINTLTEEEIAVATAKGWTVSLV